MGLRQKGLLGDTMKDLPEFKTEDYSSLTEEELTARINARLKNEEHKEIEKENKSTEKNIRQTTEQPKKKKGNWGIKILLSALFCVTAVFMYWTNKVTTPNNQTLIVFITISVLVNIAIILVIFGTGIGIELVRRFLNKFKYKSGNYVNVLHYLKSGVIKERFIKKDSETGTFRIVDKPYVCNPKLLFNYKGIPTYSHREGNPDPLDVWEEDLTGELSNAEMDIAMNSKGAFDVKEWLERNKNFILIGGFVVIAVCAAAAFFGYQTFEMLRDGSFKQATEVVCKNIPKAVETIQQTTLGG